MSWVATHGADVGHTVQLRTSPTSWIHSKVPSSPMEKTQEKHKPTPTTHLQTWNWIGIQLLLWIGRVEVKAHGPWRSTRRQKSRVTSCGPLNFMTYELPMILEQKTYSASVWMCCKNKYKISPQFIQIFHSQIQYLRENLKHPVLCTGTIFDPINARSHTVALEC